MDLSGNRGNHLTEEKENTVAGRLKGRLSLLVLAFAVAMLILPAMAFGQDAGGSTTSSPAPTIQSDKDDYPPGAHVILTGSNWKPGERVHIYVNDTEQQSWSHDADVTADANGAIRYEFDLPNWFVATYNVTATGETSGVATTSFTDKNVKFNGPDTDDPSSNELAPAKWTVDYTVHAGSKQGQTTTNNHNCSGTGSSGSKTIDPGRTGTSTAGGINDWDSLKVVQVTETDATLTLAYWSTDPAGNNKILDANNNIDLAPCIKGDFGNGTVINLYAHFKLANRAPTNLALSNNSVAENQPSGTAVGTFSSTDPDSGDTHTYSLVSGTGDGDNSSFTIDGNTLKTAASFNYEADNSYSIRVRTTDAGGLFTEKQFTISVTNVNEDPTNILLSPSSVAENQASGTEVGTLSSTDPDSPDSHTYTLVTGTGSGDNGSFTIVGDKLKTAASFNFEADNSYSIRVRTTDAGGLTFEKELTVTVTNVNEAPTDLALSNNSVAENQPAGTTVGNLSSTDEDAGDTHTYTLVAGTGDADNAQFSIQGNTLKTAASFNFEAKSSYSIRVKTTDAVGLFTEKQFTISVTNVNEAPTDLALSNNSVAENQPSGTSVGNLSSTDPDNNDTHTYTLVAGTGDGDNSSFTIDGNTLKTAASFNFEADNSYSIRVRTTDAGGLNTEKQFTITVTNVNEAPTDLALSNNLVAENQPAGTTVGNLSSTDEDAGDTHSYSLVAGAGAADNAQFNIVGDELKTAASFNFEAKSSYTVRVRATDAGGLFTEKSFAITVTNVNEAPTDLALSPSSVAENQPAGTEVGTLSSTDEDNGDTHTYTLVAGLGSDDNGSFTIVGDKLKTAASFNYEVKNSYSVRVRTTDAGGLNTEKAFTILVTNVNEAPGAPGTPTLSGASPNNGAFTLNWNAASDEDGDTLTYELQHKRSDQAIFTTVKAGISGTSYEFGGNSGNALEAEGTWTYQVRASDGSLVSTFAGPSAAIKVDRTAPNITCPSPEPTYILNSGGLSKTQNVSVSPSDPLLADGTAGSGVNTSAGTLSGPISTATTGPKTFQFTAVDNVGNQRQVTCTYRIIYDFTVASGAGFQQPINYTSHGIVQDTNVSTFKAGSTIPVKFVLKDALGNVVQAGSPPQWLTPTKGSATSQPVDESLYTDPATTGTAYLWMGTHYQYNWASQKNGAGSYWRIGVKLDDNQIYYVNISLR
jgi:hypothetical protein